MPKLPDFEDFFCFKSPYLDNRFQQAPKYIVSEILLLSSLTCTQICVISLLHDCKCGYVTIFFSKNSGHHPLGFVKYSNNILELSVKSFKQGTGCLCLPGTGANITNTAPSFYHVVQRGSKLDLRVQAIWCQVVRKLRVLALRESSNK